MSLFDEINKRTQLPKPRTPAKFETIYMSSDDEKSTPVIFNRVCKKKNPNLYNPNADDFIEQRGNICDDVNESEITSSILEINGGDTHSNQAIEERWKARVSQKQSQQSDKENVTLKKNITTSPNSKQESQYFQYKNNALMRNLIEQKMADLQISGLASSSTFGGKTFENNLLINRPMLTADSDDPDFFYLRDTRKKSESYDDSFRFEHRGIKKTKTPRQYSIYDIDDDKFVFKHLPQ